MEFTYDIFESFNTGGFLLACDRAGIRLYADRPDDTANGFIDCSGDSLLITLVDHDRKFDSLTLKKLPRELSFYKATLDRLVKENNL